MGPPSFDEWAVAPDQPQRPSVSERSEPTTPETTPSALGLAEATGTADDVVGLKDEGRDGGRARGQCAAPGYQREAGQQGAKKIGTYATHSALDEVVGATHLVVGVGWMARLRTTEVGVGAGSCQAEDDGEGEGSAAAADDLGIESTGWTDELGAMAAETGALRTLQRFSPRFLATAWWPGARSGSERSWAAVPARRRAAALSLWELARLAEDGPWPAADATEAVRRRVERKPAGTSIV